MNPRDKWTQIGCLHSILCLWGPLNHEEVAIFVKNERILNDFIDFGSAIARKNRCWVHSLPNS